jgi:hypothetical protein
MDFDLSTEIAAPPEHVFDHLAEAQDQGAEPRSMVLAMEKIPPGPTELDTLWREVVRLGPVGWMTIWSRVTRFEPCECLAIRFRGPGVRGTLQYTLLPAAAGTLVEQHQRFTLHGAMRLLRSQVEGTMERRCAERLAAVRCGVEADVGDDQPVLTGAGHRS